MVKRFGNAILIAIVCLAPTLATADDLGDANEVLCTASIATLCHEDGTCSTAPPWSWNIPQFIEIDFAGKVMRTTKASGENRVTPIRDVVRGDELIFLLGVEKERAFSLAITRKTGLASFAVAREGVSVAVFGACTPLEGRR